MENEYGMIGALVGVAIIIVGFVLVVVLGKIFHGEIQERQKDKLNKIKLDEFYQKKIDEVKTWATKEKSKYDAKMCSSVKHNTKEIQTKPVKKRVSKYNNENTLYVAYDFNILGNKSFAEVDKIIGDMLYGYRSGTIAIKTTSVVFFDIQYKTIFRDIVLINKKGGSISLSSLISNPRYYISDIDDLYNFQKVINENNTLAFTSKHLLSLVKENKINFKKEKEI